jgi:hypothetical protein
LQQGIDEFVDQSARSPGEETQPQGRNPPAAARSYSAAGLLGPAAISRVRA